LTTPTAVPEPFSAEGAALIEAGYPLEAVEPLRQAVAGGEPSAPDLLARAYLESRSWHAAAEWLTPLVQAGHVRFAGALGLALVEIGERTRAEDMLRLAVDSGDLTAANDLAMLLRDEGRAREALHVLERAADAGEPYAGANLVELHLDAGDLRTAIEAAERYAADSRPETLVMLAEVRAQQGNLDEAEGLYRRAAQLGAMRAHTAYGGFLQLARDDWAGAEREFREAERRAEPGWATALGRFLLDDGRAAEARGYLQLAAGDGDTASAEALIELDGDPTDD
jgi:tetratricopeptide (TPR) repeat protein